MIPHVFFGRRKRFYAAAALLLLLFLVLLGEKCGSYSNFRGQQPCFFFFFFFSVAEQPNWVRRVGRMPRATSQWWRCDPRTREALKTPKTPKPCGVWSAFDELRFGWVSASTADWQRSFCLPQSCNGLRFGTDVRDNYFNNIMRYIKDWKLETKSLRSNKRTCHRTTSWTLRIGASTVKNAWMRVRHMACCRTFGRSMQLVFGTD